MTTWASLREAQEELSPIKLRETYPWSCLLDDLEAGRVEAKPQSPPPATGNPLLDGARNPTASWWCAWRDADLPPSAVPAAWREWFLDELHVNWDQVRSEVDEERRLTNEAETAKQQSNTGKTQRKKTLSIWADDAIEPNNLVPTDRTGGPGRPTSMHVIKQMMEGRAKAGQLETTLKAEAAALLQLFDHCSGYRGLARPTARTIENAMRAHFNKLKPMK